MRRLAGRRFVARAAILFEAAGLPADPSAEDRGGLGRPVPCSCK